MAADPYRVLFLCTGNSARSIMAEGILNKLGAGRFTACSAGSRPAGQVNPGAMRTLAAHGHDTGVFTSKSWDVFAAPDAPQFDLIITVCDNAAGETCPVWPGQPLTMHWSIPDPAAVTGSEQLAQEAFASAFAELMRRIRELVDMPLEAMSRNDRLAALREFGARQGFE